MSAKAVFISGGQARTPSDRDRHSQGMMSELIRAIAFEVARLVTPEITRMIPPVIEPALFDVRQAATYLGRSEQSIQHLISDKELPVVRVGRRVHLHRADLDKWIESNKY